MHQVQINATQFLNKSSAIAKLANHGESKVNNFVKSNKM